MNKDPYLQFRHAEGIGDLIACILHSKMFSFITYSILGSKDYCNSCNQRRQALNILFPIRFWKLHFNSYEEKEKDLEKYFTNEQSIKPIISFKENEEKNVSENTDNVNIIYNNTEILDYTLISESESGFENFIIKTFIYKKNEPDTD